MTKTLTYTDRLVVQDCCNCGITFGVPDTFDAQRRDDHRSFYCPNGHSQSYTGKTEAEKQRERAEKAEREIANLAEETRIAWANAQAERDQAAAERKEHGRTKAKLTRTVKRAEKGVCVHCNRHFVDVARHVAGQHPELMST